VLVRTNDRPRVGRASTPAAGLQTRPSPSLPWGFDRARDGFDRARDVRVRPDCSVFSNPSGSWHSLPRGGEIE